MTKRRVILEEFEDEIGYKKPPKFAQFKPGQSGNPRGRPKGSLNALTVIQKKLNEPMNVTIAGRNRKLMTGQVIVERMAREAISGRQASAAFLLSSSAKAEASQAAANARTDRSDVFALLASPEDEEVHMDIVRRLSDFRARQCQQSDLSMNLNPFESLSNEEDNQSSESKPKKERVRIL